MSNIMLMMMILVMTDDDFKLMMFDDDMIMMLMMLMFNNDDDYTRALPAGAGAPRQPSPLARQFRLTLGILQQQSGTHPRQLRMKNKIRISCKYFAVIRCSTFYIIVITRKMPALLLYYYVLAS